MEVTKAPIPVGYGHPREDTKNIIERTVFRAMDVSNRDRTGSGMKACAYVVRRAKDPRLLRETMRSSGFRHE